MLVLKLSRVLKLNFLALFVLLGTISYAQSSAMDYKAENEGWLVDINEAFDESKRTGNPILMNATGSDWCHWCKKLTKSVFVHDEFKDWAKKNVVLLEVDFPKRKQLPAHIKQQNQSLAQAFGVRGYPTVLLFDLERNETGEFNISQLGKTGYTKTVGEFTTNIEKMMERRGTE